MIIKSELGLTNNRNNQNQYIHIYTAIKLRQLIYNYCILFEYCNITGCTSSVKSPLQMITIHHGGNLLLEAVDSIRELLPILIILFFDSMVCRFRNRCTNNMSLRSAKNCTAITATTASASITMMAICN